MEELQARLQQYNWGLVLQNVTIKTSPNSCVIRFTNGIRRQACELSTSYIKFFYTNNNYFLMR